MLRPEESSYIDNIIADPRSSEPRLAYSDWLKSRGNALCEEYLRLQCQQKHFLGEDDAFWENRERGKPSPGPELLNESDQHALERLRVLEKELDPGWLVWVLEDFAAPPELSSRGRKAAKIILGVLADQKAIETGDVALFRSPQWGEEGGLIKPGSRVALIVVYDVWLQTFFEYVPHMSSQQAREAAMEKALYADDFHAESDGLGRAFIIDSAADRSLSSD